MKYNGIELEPITKVQAFEEPKEMLVWNKSYERPLLKKVYAITNLEIESIICNSNDYDYCAEIPKRQTTEMNSLKVMEYLHKLQLWINNKDQNFEFYIPQEIIYFYADGGVVVYNVGSNNNFGEWANYSSFWGFIDNMSYKFGILKNGKVTEFKLPQIEVE